MRKVLLCLLAFFAASAQAQFKQNDDDAKYATELLKPGTSVPDFKLRDSNGKWQTINKLTKGRYTVLDFWASWCPDCRKDIPNILRIYDKFAPLGVQFVGVSFDDDADKWKAAIEQYGLHYPQVSQLKRMRESEVASAYGVKWIPSMMLIDKEGKVMLSTVLSDKLEVKLTELMAKECPITLKGATERVTIDGGKAQNIYRATNLVSEFLIKTLGGK